MSERAQSEALARLVEQNIALQRQVDRLHTQITDQFKALSELTDAKFVTYRTLIDSQAEKVALALNASEKAIGKAETATEKRFDAVNEFRAQLADQASTFMPRSEHGVEMAAITDRVNRFDEVLKSLAVWQGNITGRIAVAGIGFTVIMAVIVFVANYATRR